MTDESADTTIKLEEPSVEDTAPQKVPRWGPATVMLLEDWHFRVTRAQFGHQLSAEKTHISHLWLGVPVVIFTTIVGTGAFAAINQDTNDFWKVAAGTFSIIAAILASMQTFFGFGEKSDRHRMAATRYAATRRSIELTITSHDSASLPFIKGEMDRTGASAPQIDKATWDEARSLAREALTTWNRGERRLAREAGGKHADTAATTKDG